MSNRHELAATPETLVWGSLITGPAFVRGAERGDTLQVDIVSVTPTMDWGFVAIMPLLGTLPRPAAAAQWEARMGPSDDGLAVRAAAHNRRACELAAT